MSPSQRMRRESEEVFYAEGATVPVNVEDIDALKAASRAANRRRARLCAHPNREAVLHEMIIVHPAGTYVRPHAHVGKSESIHLIEGELDLVGFDATGDVVGVVQMGVCASGQCFYHRIPEAYIHTFLIKQDIVFHEVTQGPFRPSDTVFPPWSPDESDPSSVEAFLRDVRTQSDDFLKMQSGEDNVGPSSKGMV